MIHPNEYNAQAKRNWIRGRSRGTPALATLSLRPGSSAGDRGLRKRLVAQVRRLLGRPGEWDLR